jgi:hypothetical protein
VIFTSIELCARHREKGLPGGPACPLTIAVENPEYGRARLSLTFRNEFESFDVDAEALERAVRALRICAMSDEIATGKS